MYQVVDADPKRYKALAYAEVQRSCGQCLVSVANGTRCEETLRKHVPFVLSGVPKTARASLSPEYVPEKGAVSSFEQLHIRFILVDSIPDAYIVPGKINNSEDSVFSHIKLL
jgi:hypothetical protein